jgi:hypothetical protein
VIHLIETRPRAGVAVVAEFLVWGAGSLIWEYWGRGVFRLAVWAGWIGLMVAGIPALGALLAAALAPVPVLEFLVGAFVVASETLSAVIALYIGIRSARSLMARLEGVDEEGSAAALVEPAPVAEARSEGKREGPADGPLPVSPSAAGHTLPEDHRGASETRQELEDDVSVPG